MKTQAKLTAHPLHKERFSLVRCLWQFPTLALLASLVFGCGNPQESARKELAKLGKDYTPTVFMNCIRDGDKMAVRLFVEAGMDVNKPDSSGFTPLMIAAWNGNAEAAKLLLDHGANLTAVMADGRTAIRIAQERGHGDLSNLLAAQLPKNFIIGTWGQRTLISTVTWEFKTDAACSWHPKYTNNKEETARGTYKIQNVGQGQIVECSLAGEDGKPFNIPLLIIGDRLYELNAETDTNTNDPSGWLSRRSP